MKTASCLMMWFVIIKVAFIVIIVQYDSKLKKKVAVGDYVKISPDGNMGTLGSTLNRIYVN